MMLLSCSGDVFIRQGQLRVVLANIIIVRDKPPKANPIKKVEEHGRFGPLLGPVFLQVDYFFGTEGIEEGQTQP